MKSLAMLGTLFMLLSLSTAAEARRHHGHHHHTSRSHHRAVPERHREIDKPAPVVDVPSDFASRAVVASDTWIAFTPVQEEWYTQKEAVIFPVTPFTGLYVRTLKPEGEPLSQEFWNLYLGMGAILAGLELICLGIAYAPQTVVTGTCDWFARRRRLSDTARSVVRSLRDRLRLLR